MKYFLSLLLLASLIFVSNADSGDCGKHCHYEINGNKLKVFGEEPFTSDTDNYCVALAPWYFSKDSITEIEVLGMTHVSPCAFRDFSKVTTAKIDARSIDDHAFQFCTSLRSVELSNNVEYLGAKLFEECKNLNTITLTRSVAEVEASAFDSSYLATINVEDSLHYHSENGVLFDHDILVRYPPEKADEKYEIPQHVKIFKPNAFRNCEKIRTLVIPGSFDADFFETSALIGCSSLTDIQVSGFSSKLESKDGVLFRIVDRNDIAVLRCPPNKPVLEKYRLPDNVDRIMPYAFEGCTKIRSVYLPNNLYKIEDHAFEGCVNIDNFTLGPRTHGYSIRDGALYDRNSLLIKYPAHRDATSFAMFDYTTGIRIGAFDGANKLKNITFSNKIPDIPSETFKGCSSLEFINIPSSVNTIARDAFDGCTSLKTINVDVGSQSSCQSKNGVLFCGDTLMKYPAKKIGKEYIISGAKEIVKHAFEGCSDLQSVTIPASVTRIERDAFSRCDQLSFVEYQGSSNPADMQQAGSGFSNCPRLGKVCVSSNYVDKIFCDNPVFKCH